MLMMINFYFPSVASFIVPEIGKIASYRTIWITVWFTNAYRRSFSILTPKIVVEWNGKNPLKAHWTIVDASELSFGKDEIHVKLREKNIFKK